MVTEDASEWKVEIKWEDDPDENLYIQHAMGKIKTKFFDCTLYKEQLLKEIQDCLFNAYIHGRADGSRENKEAEFSRGYDAGFEEGKLKANANTSQKDYSKGWDAGYSAGRFVQKEIMNKKLAELIKEEIE